MARKRSLWLILPSMATTCISAIALKRVRRRFVVCGIALALTGLNAAWAEPSPRDRVLQLLTELHHPNQNLAKEARDELLEMGITGEQFLLAQSLKHPDRNQRLKLARQLHYVEEPLRSDLRSELLLDRDPEVRSIARQPRSHAALSASKGERPRYDRLQDVDDEHDLELLSFVAENSEGSAAAVAEDDEIFSIIAPRATQAAPGAQNSRRPNFLQRPDEEDQLPLAMLPQYDGWVTPEHEAPFGFTGPSGVAPFEDQESSHFVPQPDRWRNGYTPTDRYGKGHPWVDDYPGVEGHWWDPYNQNVLKGDFPVYGQHTFFSVTGTSSTSYNYRQVPTATSPFESTQNPFQQEFFGDPDQQFLSQNFFLRTALFHANDAAFKPLDWNVVLTPAVNINSLHVEELGVINPDVRAGRTRDRSYFALQEYFVEGKLADLSPNYDFMSVRAGSQFFNSDFRSFIFNDTNRGVRLFGTNFANRHQFNLIYFDMVEKDTNSQLNTFHDRHQNVMVANYYIQDFVFPGYTAQASFHMNNDGPSVQFDRNGFLARPDPAGVFQPHRVESYYLGFAGDGHMGRVNVSNAFYWATGRDSLNPIGGQEIDINAFMAAVELSYDRDWARFRTSFFYASGDDDPTDDNGEGFDTIMDNPNFAGGNFSYWQRQAIQLFGVQLVNQNSLVPSLRSSKIQGQSNFTNPGLLLFNIGFDADITPKLRMVTNANYLMFDETQVLKQFVFAEQVDEKIGLDLSVGFEWRPFHNDNMVLVFGVSGLVPDQGFKDLYGDFDRDIDTLYASFFEMNLVF